jgi:hypothetical protein
MYRVSIRSRSDRAGRDRTGPDALFSTIDRRSENWLAALLARVHARTAFTHRGGGLVLSPEPQAPSVASIHASIAHGRVGREEGVDLGLQRRLGRQCEVGEGQASQGVVHVRHPCGEPPLDGGTLKYVAGH